MSHTHITHSDRNKLEALQKAHVKQKDIAEILNKNRITIWRENKRNGEKTYSAKEAKRKSKERRKNKPKKIENSIWLQNHIEERIKEYDSPEQISGRLRFKYPNKKEKHVGKDTIYKYIYDERKDLVKYLRCQKGKWRRRYGTRIREKRRKEQKKRRIDTRPEEVETRERIGDWEGDTIVGSKGAMLTYTERKSGLSRIRKLPGRQALPALEATISIFKKIPKKKRLTFTYDNGVEFSKHEQIERELKTEIYFAYPYHSWERGCNENCNGLLRQFFPKKCNFDTISEKEVERAERILNNRPRKRLGYRTPNEVFYGIC